jgi:hypothetical protein
MAEEIEKEPIEEMEEIEGFGGNLNETIETEIKQAGLEARVSPFDPDFLLILFFALMVDGLDIFFELSGIGKILGIPLDIFTFIIIVGWMNLRMGRIVESKRARQIALQKAIQQSMQKLKHLQKIGKVSDKVFERYMRVFGKRMGIIGRLGARATRSPLTRSLIRNALVLLGELFWLVGLIPFWTISVVLMLREK